MEQTARVELDAMLEAGPMHDIFRCDESRALIEVIGTHAVAINASTFAPIFTALQSYAIDEFVLAITRLFDRPRNFPLRSLPGIIEHVLTHAESLPVQQPIFLLDALTHLNAPIADLRATSASTKVAMTALLAQMPSPRTHVALEALKAMRDKRLAHAEHVAVERIPKTTWEPADALLRTAQLMLGALGSLTSTAFIDTDGNYFLKSDAQRASVATHRLLRHLKIAPPLPYDVA